MNDSSTVGTVPSSSSRESRGSWNSSRGSSSNAQGSRRAHVRVARVGGVGVSSVGTIGVGVGVGTVGGTSIAVGGTSITVGGVVGLSFSLGLSLGHVDNSSRVGNIPASTSIAASKGGHSGRSEAIDAHSGRGAHTGVASGKAQAVGVSSIGTVGTSTINTSGIGASNWEASIAVGGIVRVGFGFSHGTSGQTYDSLELKGNYKWSKTYLVKMINGVSHEF